MSDLTCKDFSRQYYEEHSAAGLDYLGYGFWQESYARMVAEATLQTREPSPAFFDAGCACGAILQGFKATAIFDAVNGMDLSEHMVKIGSDHFGFGPEEIFAGDIADTGWTDEAFSLLHCAQVLEHVPASKADLVVMEFNRILRPGGRAFICLDAIKHGETAAKYSADPTHVNLRSPAEWSLLFRDCGFLFDVESYDRFVRSARGPTQGDPKSWYQSYPGWSVWTLLKP